MEIQKTAGVNFGATRVMTASKGANIIDVFKLNPENINDRYFIKRCNDTFKRVKGDTQYHMPQFFKAFLDEPLSCDKFYMGIKNGSIITGGLKTFTNQYAVSPGIYFHNDTGRLAKDCLLYSILAEAEGTEHDINNFLSSAFNTQYNKTLIAQSEINGVKNEIESKHPGYKFEECNEKNVDLEEFLEVNDIETELII